MMGTFLEYTFPSASEDSAKKTRIRHMGLDSGLWIIAVDSSGG
jgi:hypothetical protein